MIKFQKLPKITIICYLLSIILIGFILAEQLFEWDWLSSKNRITLLIGAALVGVFGSIVSIGKQLASFFKKQ